MHQRPSPPADVIAASHAGTGGTLTSVPVRTYAIDLTWRGPRKHPPNRVKGEGRPSPVEEAEIPRPRDHLAALGDPQLPVDRGCHRLEGVAGD